MTIFQVMLWILATVGAITSVYFGIIALNIALNYIVDVVQDLQDAIHFKNGYLCGKMHCHRSTDASLTFLVEKSTWYRNGYAYGRSDIFNSVKEFSEKNCIFTEEECARLIQLIGDAVEFNGETLNDWELILEKLSNLHGAK